jgi:hypothetical protein
MEAIAAGALGLLAYKMKDSKDDCSVKQSNNITDQNEDGIHSNQNKRIEKVLNKRAKKNKELSKEPWKNKMITPFVHPDKVDSYMNQFNELRYDMNEPKAKNDSMFLHREMELNNDFSNFENTSMNYGLMKSNEFTHNNMTPNTTQRDIAVMNNGALSKRLEQFTGINLDRKPKKEVENFSVPVKDLSWASTNGMPVMTSILESRYIPSFKNNNGNLPFEHNVKVRSGINGKVQEGTHAVYRILPKTTNELRNENDPKVSYELPMNMSIKKGQLRGIEPNIAHNRPPTFKEYDPGTIWAGRAQISRPKVNGQYHVPVTNRTTTATYHHGPAAHNTEKSLPTNMREKHKVSFKRNLKNVSGDVGINPQEKGNWVKSAHDIANETIKQTTLYNQPEMNTNPQEKGGWVRDCKDLPNQTIKQTGIYHQPQMNPQPKEKSNYVLNPEDLAKMTLKQTTLYHQPQMNTYPRDRGGYVLDHENIANQTIKQTTLYHQPQMNTHPRDKGGYVLDNENIANQTIKQTTLYNQPQMNTNPRERNGYVLDPENVANQTIKQTTLYHNPEINANPQEKYGWVRDSQDLPNQTIKQTTLYNNPEINTNPQEKYGWVRDAKDLPNQTVKQTTLFHQPQMNANPTEKNGWIRDDEDLPNQTVKQTTIYHQPQMNANPREKNGWIRDEDDLPKQTVKQTGIYNQPQMNANPREKNGWIRDCDDLPKTTIRETTILEGYKGAAGYLHEKPSLNEHIYNMETNDRKEVALSGREPTKVKTFLGPKSSSLNVALKEQITTDRMEHGKFFLDHNVPDVLDSAYTKEKQSVNDINYHINQIKLNALLENPLINNLVIQNQVDQPFV